MIEKKQLMMTKTEQEGCRREAMLKAFYRDVSNQLSNTDEGEG